MKTLNVPGIFIILLVTVLLVTVSCANSLIPADRSEYWKGYDMAEAFAKKDAMSSFCPDFSGIGKFSGSPGSIEVMRKEQKYIKNFREQGRSETFINGFQFGYEESFYQFLDLYCG